MKHTVRSIMEDLVSVQSDTGTKMEIDAAEKIGRYFEEDDYFSAHPELFGIEDTGDFLGRTVVWALKRGRGKKTIVLTGHYDAVEIESYGALKDFALSPEKLKREIIKRGMGDAKVKEHLQSDHWVFGRGTADMKGGLALGIYETLKVCACTDVSVLFVALCDEENLSAGARSAVDVLLKIKDKFDLEYKGIFILEPQIQQEKDKFLIYSGSIGKVMPLVVVKGKLAHSASPLKGINSAHLLAEIVSEIDMSTELVTCDKGQKTQVPMVQMMRDLKEVYDVSIPEYSAAYFNLLFLGGENGESLLKTIGQLAGSGANAYMEKFKKAFEMTYGADAPKEERVDFDAPLIVDIERLEEMVRKLKPDFASWKKDVIVSLTADIQKGRLTLQDASVKYVRELLAQVEVGGPIIVIGICPPYYPSVQNGYMDEGYQKYVSVINSSVKLRGNMELKEVPYFTGIGDGSYFSYVDGEKERTMVDKLILPQEIYNIPVSKSVKIGAPCFYLGPRCEDMHQWSERVYMPDLEELLPAILDDLIEYIGKE